MLVLRAPSMLQIISTSLRIDFFWKPLDAKIYISTLEGRGEQASQIGNDFYLILTRLGRHVFHMFGATCVRSNDQMDGRTSLAASCGIK